MKRALVRVSLLGGLLLLGIAAVNAEFVNADSASKQQQKPGKALRHIVLFQFKPGTTQAEIDEVTRAFAALPQKIDVIQDFEWGTDVSVEKKAAGFTHAFLVTFADEKARDKYLPHPEHQRFVKLVGPRLEKVLVFDYWARSR